MGEAAVRVKVVAPLDGKRMGLDRVQHVCKTHAAHPVATAVLLRPEHQDLRDTLNEDGRDHTRLEVLRVIHPLLVAAAVDGAGEVLGAGRFFLACLSLGAGAKPPGVLAYVLLFLGHPNTPNSGSCSTSAT